MPNAIEAQSSIVPIVGERDGVWTFLGTGFFVDDTRSILTCQHVVRDALHITVLVAPPDESKFTSHKVKAIFRSATRDISILETENVAYAQPLALDSSRLEDLDAGTEIASFDYARTRPAFDAATKSLSLGGAGMSFQMGYIRRRFVASAANNVDTKMIETSFPALRGASGAPIFRRNSLLVVGMVVGNVNEELQPIEVIEDTSPNGSPTVRYYLPMGRAIWTEHLVESLDQYRTSRSANQKAVGTEAYHVLQELGQPFMGTDFLDGVVVIDVEAGVALSPDALRALESLGFPVRVVANHPPDEPDE
jgi:hypothetical protein